MDINIIGTPDADRMNSKGRRILLCGVSGSRCGHLDLDILFDMPADQRVELIVLSQSDTPFKANQS